MKELCKSIGLSGVTFYWARHTCANIVRNKGGMHTDDIVLAVKHVDKDNATTDIYINKEWSLVDLVQNSVLVLFRALDEPQRGAIQLACLPRHSMYVVTA